MQSNKVAALVVTVFAAISCGGSRPTVQAEPAGLVPPKSNATDQTTSRAPYDDSDDRNAAIPVSSEDPTWGDHDAPVTIVQFSDFQCPFCARVEPTLDRVKETYGPKNVRIVWKNLPLKFHAEAEPAAEAAQGVFELGGSEAFHKFKALAFENQRDLRQDSYVEWASRVGIGDSAGFRAQLERHRYLGKVKVDADLAARTNTTGTPAFYINGVSLSGAQPFEKFKERIDDELQRVSALKETGTAASKVYAARVKANYAAKPARDEDDDGPAEDTTTVWKVPVGTSPSLGPKTALVTIVEFSDFQCPFCKRVEPTLAELRQVYGDKIRIVWKNEPLPFHPRALPAAMLALEAQAQKGDAGFWKAHDKIYEAAPALEDPDLERIAATIGLDVAKVKVAIAQKKHQKSIDADMGLSEDFAATGTPHFFVNGRRLVGAQPTEKFKSIIDEEIKRAEGLLRSGTAKEKLYDKLIEGGKGPPEPEKKTARPPSSPAPFRGGAQAKVVIQEFSDFQCPFCARSQATIAEIEKAYGQKVKIVWRDLPLPMHSNAKLAAEAAREAYKQKGNEGFWKMHDKMFANQQQLSRPDLEAYAREIGLDATAFAKALESHTHEKAIDADQLAASDAKISGTPGFVINGYFISGAQPFSKFDRLIRRALAEAK